MKISLKSRLRMEIKEITPEGIFEGMLSPYGNVDEGGDIVEPGAYTKNLKEKGLTRPLLWQHKRDIPIGELSLEDRPAGLWCKGKLLMEDPDAQKAHRFMKAGIVKGLSIGFETIKDAIESGVRHLKEIKLYEGSIVTFPMNEMALITSVKSQQAKGDFNQELNDRQMYATFYQMQYALQDALTSVVWADMTKEEKVSAAETIVQQFADAFGAFFPDYLDLMDETYGESWGRGDLEKKAGAMISAANSDKIKAACDKIKSGHDELMALLENDKAGATTLSTKAAEPEPEPGTSHSAADDLSEAAKMIEGLRALIPA